MILGSIFVMKEIFEAHQILVLIYECKKTRDEGHSCERGNAEDYNIDNCPSC